MVKARTAAGFIATIGVTFGVWILLIILAIVQFIISLFVINIGSSFLGYAPDANTVVLSATLLTLASIIGASLRKRD